MPSSLLFGLHRFLLFPEKEKLTQAIHFTAKHHTYTGFGNLAIEYAFIVFIMEDTDITSAGFVQPVFQRHIVYKRFRIISGISSRRHLTANNNLYSIIEETLRVTETDVFLRIACFRSRTVFNPH